MSKERVGGPEKQKESSPEKVHLFSLHLMILKMTKKPFMELSEVSGRENGPI